MFIAQRRAEQTSKQNRVLQNEQNFVKDPNWTEANQLAIDMRG